MTASSNFAFLLLALAIAISAAPSPDWWPSSPTCPDTKRCLDGSSPKCRSGGNRCDYERCYDGTFAPCTIDGTGNSWHPQVVQCQDGKTCPDGSSPQCRPGGNQCEWERCVDGYNWAPCVSSGASWQPQSYPPPPPNQPPPQPYQPPNQPYTPPNQGTQGGYQRVDTKPANQPGNYGSPPPPNPPPNPYQPPQPPYQPPSQPYGQNYCPATCNIQYNYCDKTTAPSCVPATTQVYNPRPYCACRPGYKATGVADGDTTKQWRLPVQGQEHRVWVAEGVKCDTLCTGYGIDACKEIPVIGSQCVG